MVLSLESHSLVLAETYHFEGLLPLVWVDFLRWVVDSLGPLCSPSLFSSSGNWGEWLCLTYHTSPTQSEPPYSIGCLHGFTNSPGPRFQLYHCLLVTLYNVSGPWAPQLQNRANSLWSKDCWESSMGWWAWRLSTAPSPTATVCTGHHTKAGLLLHWQGHLDAVVDTSSLSGSSNYRTPRAMLIPTSLSLSQSTTVNREALGTSGHLMLSWQHFSPFWIKSPHPLSLTGMVGSKEGDLAQSA